MPATDRRAQAAATARHRRRRLGALAAVALCAGVAGIVVGAGSGGSAGDEPQAPGYCDEAGGAGLLAAAGQSVVLRMEAEATPDLLRAARSGELGGVVLFPPEDIRGERLAAEIGRLRRAAESADRPAPLVSIDQEGGIVKRLPALAPQIPPYALGINGDTGGARLEGAATGSQLRDLGIDVDLAPVLDVPTSEDHFMFPRAFGTEAAEVSRLGVAFADALQREGVAATAKHFPGLGDAPENTDLAPTSVAASRSELLADLEPFEAAIEGRVRMVMVSSASYPALGDSLPASLSPVVVGRLLRGRLGFEGVTITDDLLAPAVSSGRPAARAATEASAAGMDLLLFARRPVGGIARGLVSSTERGELDEAELRASCARITALKAELESGEPLE